MGMGGRVSSTSAGGDWNRELWGGMAAMAGVVGVRLGEWVLVGSASGCGAKGVVPRVMAKRAGWSLRRGEGAMAVPVLLGAVLREADLSFLLEMPALWHTVLRVVAMASVEKWWL